MSHHRFAGLIGIFFGVAASASPHLQGQMDEIKVILQELAIDLSSNESSDRIDKNAKSLAQKGHAMLVKPELKQGADPSIRILLKSFNDETARAWMELNRGHRPYALSLLRGVTTHCITCHTKSNSGAQFQMSSPPDKLASV